MGCQESVYGLQPLSGRVPFAVIRGVLFKGSHVEKPAADGQPKHCSVFSEADFADAVPIQSFFNRPILQPVVCGVFIRFPRPVAFCYAAVEGIRESPSE